MELSIRNPQVPPLYLVDQVIDLLALVQRFAFAPGSWPGDTRFGIRAFVCPLVAYVSQDITLLSVQLNA